MEDAIKKLIEERLLIFNEFRDLCAIEILRVSQAIMSTFSSGNKLLICGNGGSAADSQHLAAEFVSSFSSGLKRKSLPAIALTVDTSIMSAISNDFGFESVFSRQVEGLGVRGDSILLISTSGNSKNCLAALETSKRKGMQVLTLTSQDSELYRLSDLAVGVPSKNTQYIQECHTIAYHIIAELVDLHFTED